MNMTRLPQKTGCAEMVKTAMPCPLFQADLPVQAAAVRQVLLFLCVLCVAVLQVRVFP